MPSKDLHEETSSLRVLAMTRLRPWNKKKLMVGVFLLCLSYMIWYQPDDDEVVGPIAKDGHPVQLRTTMSVQSIDEWLEAVNEHLITQPAPTVHMEPQDLRKEKMRSMGLESVDLHAFNSTFIRDPKIYHKSLTPKAHGKRARKIISCYACPRWYRSYDPSAAYNRNFKVCPYPECYFDHTGRKHKSAALVMFFSSHYPSKMPAKTPKQIWVNAKWEPQPYYIIRSSKDYDNFRTHFNWTVGYEQDDDLFWPMNLLGWRSKELLLSDEEYVRVAKGLTKTAMWWSSSHCSSHSNREDYIKELQKYVDVDLYGSCGTMECKGDPACSQHLNGTYKFYLSFENAFCKDYVTDQFFKTFASRRFIVPVVRGGFNYEKHFPHKTFINANNFKSAKELGLYLKELASDVLGYASFLKEKDKLTVLNYKNDWCDLCEMLHTNVKRKTIPDVRAITHAEGKCWTKNDIS